MNNTETRVHQSHCCSQHGCKYGEEDCPVVSGEVKQDHPCEDCDMEKQEFKPQSQASLNDQLRKLIDIANREGLRDASDFIRYNILKSN